MKSPRKRRYADFQVYMKKPFDKSHLVGVIECLVEADGESVTLGSLVGWEAKQTTLAASKGQIALDAAEIEASAACARAPK
jgi:hypothetical protein